MARPAPRCHHPGGICYHEPSLATAQSLSDLGSVSSHRAFVNNNRFPPPSRRHRTYRQAWRFWVLAIALFSPFTLAEASHPKTDVAVLKNGDRYKGEIKSMNDGMLTFKTDAAGTISLKWTHIVQLVSIYEYQIEVSSGQRYVGTLAEPDNPGEMKIFKGLGAVSIPIEEVVGIATMESGFWNRLDGAVNFGLNYTQSNDAFQYNFNGNVTSRRPRTVSNLIWNSTFNKQGGGDSASQQMVRFSHNRYLKPKVGLLWLSQLESNRAQGFDLRSTVGAGVSRALIQRGGEDLVLLGGAVYVREEITDSNGSDGTAETLMGVEYDKYSYDHPKHSLTVQLFTFRNITSPSRHRAQASVTLSWEVIRDFNVSIGVTDTYDSRPPTEIADRNDVSVVTSVGYTF